MNEFVVHPSLSRTLLLNTAQDVGQDHFPTFSIFYGVGGLVIDCCLLIFAGFFVMLCQMLADALMKDQSSTLPINSLWWMDYITNSVDKTKQSCNIPLLYESTIKQPVLPFVLFNAGRILHERNTSPSRRSHHDKACT